MNQLIRNGSIVPMFHLREILNKKHSKIYQKKMQKSKSGSPYEQGRGSTQKKNFLVLL